MIQMPMAAPKLNQILAPTSKAVKNKNNTQPQREREKLGRPGVKHFNHPPFTLTPPLLFVCFMAFGGAFSFSRPTTPLYTISTFISTPPEAFKNRCSLPEVPSLFCLYVWACVPLTPANKSQDLSYLWLQTRWDIPAKDRNATVLNDKALCPFLTLSHKTG